MDALLELPAHLRRRLMNALESGVLVVPYSPPSLRSVLGLREGGEDIIGALVGLERLGITGRAAAAWIQAVEEAVARTPRPDLVWSGPEVPGLHARDTRRVYEELLGSAEHSVWMCSYAFFDGPKAFEVLARRMDERPRLCATLLLNIQRRRGDNTEAQALVRRFADHFWATDWPGVASCLGGTRRLNNPLGTIRPSVPEAALRRLVIRLPHRKAHGSWERREPVRTPDRPFGPMNSGLPLPFGSC